MKDPGGKRPGNPLVHLLVSAVLVSAAEVFLKEGAAAGVDGADTSVLGVAALASGATWIGIGLYILSFLSWLHVLRLMPVSEAYALITIVQVLVPAAAWMFLGETISVQRGIGIALVVLGTFLVVTAPTMIEVKS